MNKIFGDERSSKQIINAAKKIQRKRTATTATDTPLTKKRRRSAEDGEASSPADFEQSLKLPQCDVCDESLSLVVLHTNRAPLCLAFAVTLLKYTMPDQPLSSRLSLAQAVVSANSRTKAVNIGLESGKSAEEEGWGQGNPTVKVMGREIRVMRRWDYDWKSEEKKDENKEEISNASDQRNDPALWGLDLEALKKDQKKTAAPGTTPGANMPIYVPQSARSYLLRSFAKVQDPKESSSSGKKDQPSKQGVKKEKNLGMLLRALDLLHQSWVPFLNAEELDRRSWSWYVKVRPVVESGAAGWGGKGEVKLSAILALRRS